MRLYLLPISTRRTLIYCQRLNVTTTSQQGLLDKGTDRAAKLWASWEKKESGWQRKVVDYGNQALKRIPYEEWGLKSIPPLSARRKEEELSGKGTVEVQFPGSILPEDKVLDVLRTLGTERQSLHKQRMIYCFIGMPITAPIAILPVIPNLPFFYLVFRAWSHWRALSGSKHVEFLLDKKLIVPKPSKILDELYTSGNRPFDTESFSTASLSETKGPAAEAVPDALILNKSDAKRIAELLEMPELDIELDRAVWQVEKAIDAARALKEEKNNLDSANARPGEKTGEKK